MPKVDNFNHIRDFLDFQTDDDYYLLELIGRKKDSIEVTHSQDHFGSYYITSLAMFNALEEEIKTLCRMKHCRAYINLNPKSKKKTALKLMKNLLGKLENDDFSRLFGAMTSAAGECGAQPGRKYFLIDVDDIKDTFTYAQAEVFEAIENCRHSDEVIVKGYVTTASGFHVITTPFDCSDFAKQAAGFKTCHAEVKHNSPTLLYIDIED